MTPSINASLRWSDSLNPDVAGADTGLAEATVAAAFAGWGLRVGCFLAINVHLKTGNESSDFFLVGKGYELL